MSAVIVVEYCEFIKVEDSVSVSVIIGKEFSRGRCSSIIFTFVFLAFIFVLLFIFSFVLFFFFVSVFVIVAIV